MFISHFCDAKLRVVETKFRQIILGKVRLKESDPINKDIECIQKVQNKLLRMLSNTKLLDMVSTSMLLKQTKMMSVNQINCRIKIQEIWKALNIPDYPIQVERQSVNDVGPSTRARFDGRLNEKGNNCLSQKSCLKDAIRLWNKLLSVVTECGSFHQIKKQAKIFAKMLPV